jgi:hypothetical protein
MQKANSSEDNPSNKLVISRQERSCRLTCSPLPQTRLRTFQLLQKHNNSTNTNSSSIMASFFDRIRNDHVFQKVMRVIQFLSAIM